MRLNWFSPLPPQHTDIAHYTARLAPSLMRHFDVVFWTDQNEARPFPREAIIKIYEPSLVKKREFLGELLSGVNIYNFGNDIRFHKAIYQVARSVPGISILHDARMHHFVFANYRYGQPEWEEYIRLAGSIYGKNGASVARKITDSHGTLIDGYVEEMPFTEPVLWNSVGAICHSNIAAEDIKGRSSVPILQLPLPFESLARTSRVRTTWEPPFRLIMFGYIGTNRRLTEILAALKDVRGEIEFQFDVYGILQNVGEFERVIAVLGLEDRVALHGFVPEQILDDAIASSHLAFNLRHPSMGEASGGILRSWTHATPTLVTDGGWYATLPDCIVKKISIENEHVDLIRALKDLASNPKRYEKLGLVAAEFARAHHSPDNYVQTLAQALGDLPELFGRFAARRMMQSVATHARSRDERSVFVERAHPQITSLFS